MTDIPQSIQPNVFRTPNHHGYNLKFSSYQPNLLACATSINYGISGMYFWRHKLINLNLIAWQYS